MKYMIMDCHVHITFKKSNVKNSPNMEIAKLIATMEKLSIDKACLVPFPETYGRFFSWTEEDSYNLAEFLADVSLQYSDKFHTLLWINSLLPIAVNKEIIEKHIINGPLDGVKLHIQMNARDKRMEPLADILQAYNIPLLFHAWYKTVQKCQYESDPSDIADLAKRFPKLRILMAHLSGCGKRGVQDIKRHENILIDTSGSQPEDGLLEYAANQLGEDRVVFGSDYPGRDMGTQLGRIFSIDISDDAREKILYKNAVSFLKKG